MFTGIIQGIAEITDIEDMNKFRRYQLKLPQELTTSLTLGASISNDGCCLTISHVEGNKVSFDLVEETLRLTTLGDKKVGDRINIERAARIGDEIGGHLMSGHISCRGKIVDSVTTENNHQITVELPMAFSRYVLYKGFIGIDGISLTVGEVENNTFKLYLIPETLERTTLGDKQCGDEINIEIDPQTQAIVDTVNQIMESKQSF